MRLKVSPAEWQARLECAALYRLVALHGWTDLIFNHISVRVLEDDERILVNPYGWLYEEITASSLITVDLQGNILLNPHDTEVGINPAGYIIHSAIHSARPNVACVIHTHSRAGMAVSAMKCGLLPMTQTAIGCFPLAYHDYEGPTLNSSEKDRLITDLGDCNYLVLRNHGLLVCGCTAAHAFRSIHLFETACASQVDAIRCGDGLVLISEQVVRDSHERLEIGSSQMNATPLYWPALLRMLDRRDPSWRA